MTSTQSGADRTDAELFDADGHVMEDVPAIIEKMDQPWQGLREGLLTNPLARLHGMTILPPLGYLSTLPVGGGPGFATRGPRETGLDPESWTYFLEAVGIQERVFELAHGAALRRVTGIVERHLRESGDARFRVPKALLEEGNRERQVFEQPHLLAALDEGLGILQVVGRDAGAHEAGLGVDAELGTEADHDLADGDRVPDLRFVQRFAPWWPQMLGDRPILSYRAGWGQA